MNQRRGGNRDDDPDLSEFFRLPHDPTEAACNEGNDEPTETVGDDGEVIEPTDIWEDDEE